jgi:hypothetical protein
VRRPMETGVPAGAKTMRSEQEGGCQDLVRMWVVWGNCNRSLPVDGGERVGARERSTFVPRIASHCHGSGQVWRRRQGLAATKYLRLILRHPPIVLRASTLAPHRTVHIEKHRIVMEG